MARPIKETPILYGEDARRFLARMNEKRTISPEERAEMDAAYEMGMEMMRRGEEEKRLYRERQRLLKLQAQIQDAAQTNN
jgi:hypothetical protein